MSEDVYYEIQEQEISDLKARNQELVAESEQLRAEVEHLREDLKDEEESAQVQANLNRETSKILGTLSWADNPDAVRSLQRDAARLRSALYALLGVL